jgi:hypothetical protein
VRTNFWRLRDEGRIEVGHAAFFRRQDLADSPQNFEAADSANRFIAVRKMMSDVAFADRA